MAGVTLQQLAKRFPDGSTAVSGLSLEVKDGEFLVLVGPSGCGKTTALRMIAGLETPSSGRVIIGDEDVTDVAPGRRDVAMVFQNYALYPHFTVRENIGFPLRMRRMPSADAAQRIGEVAESLHIESMLDKRPGELSGGQRQRVALARALVRQPAVFLFDEPLSNLDAQVRATTRAELVRLHRQLGTTMIYVTHDQVEAMSMAQRVAVMHEGRLEQLAAPLEVYRTPATLFTARFVGAPSINCLVGHVAAEGDRQRFIGPITVDVSSPLLADATLALRPEQVRLVAAETPYAAVVLLVEPLGAETILHLRLHGGAELTSRMAGPPSVEVGARVHLSLDTAGALVYDGTGRLVGRGRA
ncbi:MAG: ABC transporter ATP-binding protein [Gemmatimonadaceae bacterium]|nr:ABC transporter ATP-binding protein [Gemmatimonadaceae bacterium]